MAQTWKHKAFSDKAAYAFTIETSGAVGLESGGHQQAVGVGSASHEVYRFGPWVVEAVRTGKGYSLVLCAVSSRMEGLELNFEKGKGTVTVQPQVAGRETKRFSDISLLRIAPNGVVTAFQPGESTDVQPEAIFDEQVQALKTQLEEQKKLVQERDREITALKKELSERSGTEKALTAAKAKAEKLQTQLQEEHRLAAALESAAAARLEDGIRTLEAEKEKLGEELGEVTTRSGEVLRTLESIRAEIGEKNERIEAMESAIAMARGELADSESLMEVRTLDLEAARKDLDSLRIQLEQDGITAELLGQEPFLRDNSFRKTLEQVKNELEAAERRLGRIVLHREKINQTVQDTILRGDGTVPLTEELGGIEDGDGRDAETADP